MYDKPIDKVYGELNSSEKGLTSADAKRLLDEKGYNQIEDKHKISPWKILIGQFNSPVIWVLLVAVVISIFIKEGVDALIISVILILNAVIGFFQEYKAEKAIDALKKMASLKAVVLREGVEHEINAREIVPGDIVLLETGEKIPADARLIEIANLETQEAALTGESLPIKKILDVLKEGIGIADRKNMVFSGTIITKGRAKAIVTGTGMTTELGKIAHMIQTTEADMTPLQLKLKQLGKWLGLITLIVSLIVFTAGYLRTGNFLEMFITALSLAVAAIPEGLPIVVTIAMAIGIKRMVKRNALIRNLPSVETLGSTTVICSDKTGTLTHNQMTVTKIFVDNKIIDVTGSGYSPEGTFSEHTGSLNKLLEIGTLNCDARLEKEDEEGDWRVLGDPTEGALVVSASKAGLDKDILEKKNKRIDEIPFDSERKCMTTIHQGEKKKYVYTKGAPDVILNLCDFIYENGRVERLTKQKRKDILEKNEEFANQALRVLGFAFKELRSTDKKGEYEKSLVFVGLQAMIDPPREEVKEAIANCETAGIKVVMITGDFKGTAVAIAKELGIKGKAISGEEIDKINLDDHVEDITVYARVNPEHKLKIVEALKKKGHIVAMTGDGVNDAPALKKADIGIAMGITGTDVAKEASDMLLLDDNFTSIVNAVEEGRGVYDNIRKFLAFLLSGNIGEVLVLFLASIIGLPLPLIAKQILMINLVTDGLPATALGADPFEPGELKRKPKDPKQPIYAKLHPYLIWYPAIMVIVTLSLFAFFVKTDTLIKAQTVAFLTIAMFELYQAFSCRSTIYPVFKVGVFRNKWLTLAVIGSFLSILAIIYIPFLQNVFGTTALNTREFMAVFLLSSLGSIYLELHKYFTQRRLTAQAA